MLWPGPDSACYYLDPSAGLTDGGLWKDSSRFGLHCTPVGYAAPNWGYSLGPSGAPRITFDGAAQYGTIAAPANARFFTAAPLTEMTIAVVARHNSPAAGDRIFSCNDAVSTRGFGFAMQAAAVMQIAGYNAVGALIFYPVEGDNGPYISRTRLTILSGRCVDATARRWVDGVGRVTTYGVAAAPGPIAYDTAVVPTVGRHTSGGLYFDGDLYFLGIWPLVFTDSEARAFSAYWMDRT